MRESTALSLNQCRKVLAADRGSAPLAAAMVMPLVTGLCIAAVGIIHVAGESERLRICASNSAHIAARYVKSEIKQQAHSYLVACFPGVSSRISTQRIRGYEFVEVKASAQVDALTGVTSPWTISTVAHVVVESQ